MNLSQIDLNLLVSLQALLAERSVTRAAKRVGLTQPAMSHCLSRLRRMFGDPLLVRAGRSMVSTVRAEQLVEPLHRILQDAERLINPTEFDPATANGEIRVATTEYVMPLVLPAVLPRLMDEAPGLKLQVRRWQRPETWQQLRDGDVDLAIHGALDDAPAGFYRQRLFSDNYACVLRAGHPMAGKRLTLKRFVELKHALIAVTGVGKGHVNMVLESQGLSRDIVLTVPSFLAAPMIVAQSDLVLTLPAKLADQFARSVGLLVMKPPLELPDFDVSMLWHERRHHDPAHAWLRALIKAQTKPLDGKRRT